MKFTKMHGLGNDFVVCHRKEPLSLDVFELARKVCDRHLGVGADGLVFIQPSEQADFAMRIINADGTEAEQCGNAVRCVAKYYYDRISGARRELTVETKAGLQKVWMEEDKEGAAMVRVDMGPPVLEGRKVPTVLDKDMVVDEPVTVEDTTFHFTAVSMGNPHAVIFVEDAVQFPVENWGPRLETHSLFPNKTNVEFVTVHSPHELDMRVWERGVGQTMACGTGACASLVAAVLTGKAERRATVHLKGGDLQIEWNEEDGHVYMIGPAVTVFEGEWAL
ncbi:diaminopimelate epimerase [Marinithermofilum abyssi]|uniref:Diaminopimelate epimerase n=1 Tax=Marinithermofilum abyssi TaxID=1571185 RepID=A0A8J2VD48_9BACL|nr:diaminopimelate epimerase [Marinithermofilum abyssi]GGE22184.1 diaminopimelate epimerase [Marinithermofilum abyssi]